MKVRLKGIYAKTKKLTLGQVRTYYYDRHTGKRLPDDPGSSDFLLAVERARRAQGIPVPGERTFAHLLRECHQSLGYAKLKVSTRKEYDRHVRYVEPVLATFPVRDIKRKHIEKIMTKFVGKPTLAVSVADL